MLVDTAEKATPKGKVMEARKERSYMRTTISRIRAATLTVLLTVAAAGAWAPAAAAVPPPPGAEFGIDVFTTEVRAQDGTDETRAGAHPHSARAQIEFTSYDPLLGKLRPIDEPRHIITRLPPGFTGNPKAAEACPIPLVSFEQRQGYPSACPQGSWVGIIRLDGNVDVSQPVVNVVPEPGFPAEFGFTEVGQSYMMYPELRSESDFGLNIEVPRANVNGITKIDMTFCSWGVVITHQGFVSGSSTYRCLEQGEPGAREKPFLTNPATECPAEAPFTELSVDSWGNPGHYVTKQAVSPLITSCDTLEFEPSVDIQPSTTQPGAATGLKVDMAFPQEDNAEGQAPAALKKAVVTLPEGMSVNPAAADGLRACADGELMLRSKDPMRCPDASKIGTVKAVSPLLNEPLEGGVYLRSQNSNDPESGEMFRLALVLENEDRGIDVRLPGQVRVNAQTGRIETTFDNNPELPVSNIELTLKDGPRAPLSMPSTCGEKVVDTVLTSWGRQTKTLRSAFTVDCAAGLGGFKPGFAAGTQDSTALSSSPFSLRTWRADGEREFKQIREIKLPEGLLADVSSVELCPAAAADAGTCGESSRVGRLEVAAGSGASPLWVPQAGKAPTRVHLSGPYRGAPYSLSIVVPAQAGPFDLGSVVVRSALHVDERTARVSSGVDQSRILNPDGGVAEVLEGDVPRILKGVILDQREIRVLVDRDGFMINPTDCSDQQITAQLLGYGGGQAAVANRFRSGGCAKLGFAPEFSAQILDKGRKSTLRSWHPRTRFTVVPRSGDANIGGARVALPSSTILDQGNIGTTCTRAQMADRACPAKSVVGYAKAWSPLLRDVVEGPVYLAANGGVRPLPDLAAVLDGEIRVVLQGEISTLRTGGRARLQNTFRVVPDAPVTRFELTMRGGKNRGLLVNSTDLCRSSERGVAHFTGQNNRQSRSALRLTPSFKGCARVRRQAFRQVQQRKVSRLKARLRAARKAARS